MEKLKGYVNIPITTKTRAKYLKEEYKKGSRFLFEDTTIELTETIPPELIQHMLENIDVKIEHIFVPTYVGKNNICGISKTKSKTLRGVKNNCIRVRFEGENLEDLMGKISIVKKELNKFNITPTSCLWDRPGVIRNTPLFEDEKELISPDPIDKEDLIKRTQLELKAFNDN